MSKIERFIRKILWNVNALCKAIFILCKYRNRIRPYIRSKGEPIVVFGLTQMNYRFYVPIIRHFSNYGYLCIIHTNYKFLSNSDPFFKWIADLGNIYISFNRIKKINILIKDNQALFYQNIAKSVIISDQAYDESLKPRKKNLLPFSMHPDQYKNLCNINLEHLRGLKRKVKIFFSGNISSEGYNDDILNKLHSKLSRRQILELIRESYYNEISDCASYSNDYENKILLMTSEFWVDDKQKNHKITKSNWFYALSQADFFLACPGFSHPMCHNLIESMSVGCIPILEHNEYLQPNLINNVNCISFNGKEELLEKINYVLNLNAFEVERMRKNVISYYEQYLTSGAIVNTFNQVANNSTLYYYSSAQSVELFKSKLKCDVN